MDRITEQMYILISPVYLPTSSFSRALSGSDESTRSILISTHIHAQPHAADNGWPPLYEKQHLHKQKLLPLPSLRTQV